MFKSLSLEGWRQINRFDLAFHDRLTVLTGANGSGKTTVLNLLSKHFGWPAPFVSTPRIGTTRSVLEYVAGLWSKLSGGIDLTAERVVGEIHYRSGSVSKLVVPVVSSATYEIEVRPHTPIPGLHIPSHRPLYNYQAVQHIPTTPRTREEAFNQYRDMVRHRYFGTAVQPATRFIKETLISLALFGYGNQAVSPNPASVELFEQFERTLSTVLPPQLGFEKLSIRTPEVVLVTRSGDFPLDAVSGGIAAIIDMAWQIFMYAPHDAEFVVTIDEPENHLHPELQRSVLRSFIGAFPKAQFIVATHNPFIVGSVPDSNVYVLRSDPNDRASSLLLDLVNKAGTSNDILRDVLGLSFTTALWVDDRLQAIIRKYEQLDLDAPTLARLRSEMAALGLEKLIPNTIASVVEKRRPQ